MLREKMSGFSVLLFTIDKKKVVRRWCLLLPLYQALKLHRSNLITEFKNMYYVE